MRLLRPGYFLSCFPEFLLFPTYDWLSSPVHFHTKHWLDIAWIWRANSWWKFPDLMHFYALRWIATVSWSPISGAVSAHLQTNHRLDRSAVGNTLLIPNSDLPDLWLNLHRRTCIHWCLSISNHVMNIGRMINKWLISFARIVRWIESMIYSIFKACSFWMILASNPIYASLKIPLFSLMMSVSIANSCFFFIAAHGMVGESTTGQDELTTGSILQFDITRARFQKRSDHCEKVIGSLISRQLTISRSDRIPRTILLRSDHDPGRSCSRLGSVLAQKFHHNNWSFYQ